MADPMFTDPAAEASYVHHLGVQAWRDGFPDKALNYFRRALELKEKLANLSAAASTFHMIGIIYAEKKDWENAARYFLRSLTIDADDGHYDGVAVSLHDIAVMCGKRGDKGAETALDGLANLIVKPKREGGNLDPGMTKKLLERVPPDLRTGIRHAIFRLMQW